MNDLRKTFVQDQQEAAADDNRRHQAIVAQMLACQGAVPLDPIVLDLLVKRMMKDLSACEHVFEVGWFRYPGQVYWLLGINSMVCADCLGPAHMLLEASIIAGSDTCDFCGEPEPSGLFREAVITLNHVLAFGCEGFTCCGQLHS